MCEDWLCVLCTLSYVNNEIGKAVAVIINTASRVKAEANA